MKKIIIITLAVIITGLASSCSKESSVKPATVNTQRVIVADRTDVGSGD